MNRDERADQLKLVLVELLAAPIISVVTGKYWFEFSDQQQVMFSVILFCAFQLVHVWYLTSAIESREKHAEVGWKLRSNIDKELVSTSYAFGQLVREAYQGRDLFVEHFQKEILRVTKTIRDVCERKELRVKAEHFLNVENVLDAFRGDTERVWRYTWRVSGDEELFDDLAWKQYFAKTLRMIQDNEIKEIRTILVLETDEALGSPRVQKLLDFFATNAGYRCWLVSLDTFRELCDDNDVPSIYIDFGIYGQQLLFLTERYEPAIEGVFTKDTERIQHYRKLFDSVWDSTGVGNPNPSVATALVSLSELYEFDESVASGSKCQSKSAAAADASDA